MSNDQLDRIEKLLREVNQRVLDLTLRVMEVEMRQKREAELATTRHTAVFEWVAPDSWKQSIDALDYTEIETPRDIHAILAQAKRARR
uniref:Uncharacterized protein n=2 Tax=Aureimonas altamirensis TaxID=370622 RepID=A0A0P0YXS5_9HYPH|nr:hypothetical protein [Aureimonas altamirensis]